MKSEKGHKRPLFMMTCFGGQKYTSYKFEKLKSNTEYSFQVRACNDNGQSKWAEIFGETCSKTSSLVAMLPIGKKDAKNKCCPCACANLSKIDSMLTSMKEIQNMPVVVTEDESDHMHDAAASSPAVKLDIKEGKSKDSASNYDDDDDIHVEDKMIKIITILISITVLNLIKIMTVCMMIQRPKKNLENALLIICPVGPIKVHNRFLLQG